jgi:hypothetical protein
MNIAPTHLDALHALGYSESEARFLYLVATYSGYFTTRQFLACTGAHWGKRTTNFWSKIKRSRHTRTERFPKSGAFHHLFSGRLYRKIEKEHPRNRRVHELEFIKRRIAILDFVIANQEYEYLETEAAKTTYFCNKLGVNERYLPARLYLGQKTARSSVRYFVDGCPMFLGFAPPVVTFTYVHEGPVSFAAFIHHLENYLPLFRQLCEFRMLYVSRTDVHFPRATEIFNAHVKIPLESDIAEDLLRYFRIRKMWDEKQYTVVTDAELIFRNEARSRFRGATFEGLYRNWKNGQVSAASIEERFRRNDRRRNIAFGTYQLRPMQVSPGDSANLGAEVLRSPENTKPGESENHLRRKSMPIVRKAPEMMSREIKLEQPVNELLEDYARFIESSPDHVINAVLKKVLWRDLDYRKWRGERRAGQPATDKPPAVDGRGS